MKVMNIYILYTQWLDIRMTGMSSNAINGIYDFPDIPGNSVRKT